MPSGKVCSFNEIIGCGYIEPDDGSERVAVSYRDIKKQGYKILHEGQLVDYQLTRREKGLIAVDVVARDETADEDHC
jgi:cold shock protein